MAVAQPLRGDAPAGHRETDPKAKHAIGYAHQAERLALYHPSQEDESTGSTQAIEAEFVTGQDPVIKVANGGRLPAVPLDEALKLNKLKDAVEGRPVRDTIPVPAGTREAKDGTVHGARRDLIASGDGDVGTADADPGAPLRMAVPANRTNPLFPPLPTYGPPTLLLQLQCLFLRACSSVGSLTFLAIIVLGSLFTSIPRVARTVFLRVTLRNPRRRRPFFDEEQRRESARSDAARAWAQRRHTRPGAGTQTPSVEKAENGPYAQGKPDAEGHVHETYIPTEGGPDPLVCDVGYYAREQGLDCEKFDVRTEDGFIIELLHLYNPLAYTPRSAENRESHRPDVFPDHVSECIADQGEGYSQQWAQGQKRYPVLLLHGLLQSAGAYCSTGASSLAFYLAKSGYDVWLGNNRCGFNPRHELLQYSDPRMWAWNIRQMGVMDLPALVSRVLTETGFSKCALVAHSQGTTQTMVALAKEQRPELGQRLSCVCLLAPAAYAGPLIGKAYFKFMRLLSPSMFRMVFGIHAFIPFMLTMHRLLPASIYGFMGYRVFSFLFNWSDARWERSLRDRCFQFAPVYVSAESMRWWLGRDCFARQKCILATKRETRLEDEEDLQEDEADAQDDEAARARASEESQKKYYEGRRSHASERDPASDALTTSRSRTAGAKVETERGKFAWYDSNVPPMAFWVAGSDDLVDGRRLLRRFERGREPYVNVVHTKIIPEYEHLDVIWAMDSIEQVGREVAEVIWNTAADQSKKACRTPWFDVPLER